MNWVIALPVAAAVLAGALLWYRRYGPSEPLAAPDGVSWFWRLWDGLRDALRGEPGAPAAEPVPVDAPGMPLPPPSPPPTATPPPLNGNASPVPGPPVHVAQADLLHAIHGLVGMAATGDVHVVRRVIATIAAGTDAMGAAVGNLATRLSEPDKHYGHEIWEPLAMAGAQFRSGSLHAAQSAALVASLLATSVGELAQSGRQAPHHSQLNGGNR